MNNHSNSEAEFFKKIEGKPVWNPVMSVGTILMFQIGNPFLHAHHGVKKTRLDCRSYAYKTMYPSKTNWRKNGRVFIEGEWSIIVGAEWELNFPDKRIHVASYRSKLSKIEKSLEYIDGEFLKEIKIKPDNSSMSLEFFDGIYILVNFKHQDNADVTIYERGGRIYEINSNGISLCERG